MTGHVHRVTSVGGLGQVGGLAGRRGEILTAASAKRGRVADPASVRAMRSSSGPGRYLPSPSRAAKPAASNDRNCRSAVLADRPNGAGGIGERDTVGLIRHHLEQRQPTIGRSWLRRTGGLRHVA